MTITALELKQAVALHYEEDVDTISGSMLSEMEHSASGEGVELPDIGLVELEDEWGGEGQGDNIGFVLKVGTQYFKFEGTWVSHDGAYYDYAEFEEVQPKVVPRTIWV